MNFIGNLHMRGFRYETNTFFSNSKTNILNFQLKFEKKSIWFQMEELLNAIEKNVLKDTWWKCESPIFFRQIEACVYFDIMTAREIDCDVSIYISWGFESVKVYESNNSVQVLCRCESDYTNDTFCSRIQQWNAVPYIFLFFTV